MIEIVSVCSEEICLIIDECLCSLSAQLENLEIDQYIWGILNSTSNSDYPPDEVTIDSQANWKPSSMAYNIKVSVYFQNCCLKIYGQTDTILVPTYNFYILTYKVTHKFFLLPDGRRQ